MVFSVPNPAPYRESCIYLGKHGKHDISLETERHAICIAGAGAGKGVALIAQNLMRWPKNCLVVDPKGEALEITHKARAAMGQKVVGLDPFRVADVSDDLRGSFNPLAAIEPDGFAAREALQVIADGLVKVHDPKHMEWVEGTRDILAGVMAFIVDRATPESKNLLSIRSILLQTDEELHATAQDMMACGACGGLAKAAGVTILTAIESTKGMERDFLSGARRATKWLDSPQIASCLETSSFDLADLKTGKLSVFLVLPPHLLDTHAAFLRLFVRTALFTMAAGGSGKGERCLFLLDEVFSLGKIDEIAVAAGLMRSYGVNLFLFFQDLGQCVSLYGQEGAETFFGNSDAHIFFGNTDPLTLGHISHRLGVVGPSEIGKAPVHVPSPRSTGQTTTMLFSGNSRNGQQAGAWIGAAAAGIGNAFKDLEDMAAAHEMAEWQHKAQRLGRPRLAPEEVRAHVAKLDGDIVARNMIVFGKGAAVWSLRPVPYFEKPAPQASAVVNYGDMREFAFWIGLAVLWFVFAAVFAHQGRDFLFAGALAAAGICGMVGMKHKPDNLKL